MPVLGAVDFDAVYCNYKTLLRATLRRYGVREADLDDVTQEALITIHRRLGEFEGRSSIETWLHAVCWRMAVGYRRRAHIRLETSALPEARSVEGSSFGDSITVERLHAQLDALPEADRDLLALHEIGDLSIAELALLTDCARSTVRERLRRASLALRKALELPADRAVAAATIFLPGTAHASGLRDSPDTGESLDYLDEDCCFSSRGAMTIVVWRKRSTAPVLKRMLGVLRESKARAKAGITYLSVIERTAIPPDRAARRVNAEIMAIVGDGVRAAAFAIEHRGFLSLVPAVLNSAMFLARSPLQCCYFTGLPRAVSWLAPHCEDDTVQSLTARVERMRARLDARERSDGHEIGATEESLLLPD